MNLENLANKELKIFQKVRELNGTMEEKFEQIKSLGIFDEYKSIFNQYAKAHKENLEALKRCLFLYWYSLTEPGYFTGIKEFDVELIKKV